MSVKTYTELIAEAEAIENETVVNANTAHRIGVMLVDIIDSKIAVQDVQLVPSQVFYVEKDADPGVANGKLLSPYATVQAALDAVALLPSGAAYAIDVGVGLFNEVLAVPPDRHITIRGRGFGATTIGAVDSSNHTWVVSGDTVLRFENLKLLGPWGFSDGVTAPSVQALLSFVEVSWQSNDPLSKAGGYIMSFDAHGLAGAANAPFEFLNHQRPSLVGEIRVSGDAIIDGMVCNCPSLRAQDISFTDSTFTGSINVDGTKVRALSTYLNPSEVVFASPGGQLGLDPTTDYWWVETGSHTLTNGTKTILGTAQAVALDIVLGTGNTSNGHNIVMSNGDKIVFETTGQTDATNARLNMPHQSAVLGGRKADDSGNVELMRWGGPGNYILFGNGGGVAGEWHYIDSGGMFRVIINGSNAFEVDGTQIYAYSKKIISVSDPTNPQDAATKAYVDARVALFDTLAEVLAQGNTSGGTNILMTGSSTISFGATPSTTAKLNFPHQTLLIAGKNNAGSGDVSLIYWGGPGDTLIFGDTSVAAFESNIKNGGYYRIYINSANYFNLTQSALQLGTLQIQGVVDPTNPQDAATKNYVDTYVAARTAGVPVSGTDDGKVVYAQSGAYLLAANVKVVNSGSNLSVGTSPATSGAIRMTNNDFVNIKSSGGTTVNLIGMSSADTIGVGSSSSAILNMTFTTGAGSFSWAIGANGAMSLSNSRLAIFPGGTTPATAGDIAVRHGFSFQARNQLNNNNTTLMSYGVSGNDQLNIGSTLVTNTIFNAASAATYTIQHNSADEYTFTSTTADFKDNVLQFGTGPATTGTLRFANNVTIMAGATAAAANAVLLAWSSADLLTVGDANVANTTLNIKAAGTYTLQVSGAAEYTFTSTIADFKDNVLSFGTNPSTNGTIRFPHNNILITGKDSDTTTNRSLFRWGETQSDVIAIGDEGIDGTQFRVATGGFHDFKVNGTTVATIGANYVSIPGGSTAAGAGNLRVHQGFSFQGRSSTSTDVTVMSWGASADRLAIGSSGVAGGVVYTTGSGTLHRFVVSGAATDIMQMDNASVLLPGSIFLAISGGGTAAGSGNLRLHNTFSIQMRNAANNGNVFVASGDASDNLFFGDNSAASRMQFQIKTGAVFDWRINNVSEFQMDSAAFYLADNVIITGSSGNATVGIIRTPHNVTFWGGRSSGGADRSLLRWGTVTDTLIIGDGNIAATQFNVGSGGSYTFQINNATTFTIGGNVVGLNSNVLNFGSTTVGTGLVRIPHNSFFLYGRNSGDSADRALIRWGTATNDVISFGEDNITGIYSSAGTDFRWFISPNTEYMRLNNTSLLLADAAMSIQPFTSTTAASGVTLTVAGQTRSASTGTSVGGILLLQGGQASGSTATHTGGKLQLRGGDATGSSGTRTGGDVEVRAGTGATANGVIKFLDGVTTEYTFSSTTANFGGNDLTNVASFAPTSIVFGGTTVAAGLIRVPHNSQVIVGKNNAGNADVNLVRWGVTATDTLDLGDTTNIAGMNFRLGSGTFGWEIASGTVLVLNTTTFDLRGNVNTIQFPDAASVIKIIDSATAATGSALTIQGQVRSASTGTSVGGLVTVKGGDATGATATHTGGKLQLRGGDATGASGTRTGGDIEMRAGTGATANGIIKFLDGSNTEYTFSSTIADFKDNALQFGANPSTGATINFSNAQSINWRTSGGTNVLGIDFGLTNADRINVGTNNAAQLGLDLRAGTTGNFRFFVNSNAVVTIADTFVSLDLGGTASGAGLIRVKNAAGGSVLASRNTLNNGNSTILAFGAASSDRIDYGDTTIVNHVWGAATGASYWFSINGTNEYVFDASTADFRDNQVNFSTNVAATGSNGRILVTHNTTVISGRNALNNGYIGILNWGVVSEQIAIGNSGVTGGIVLSTGTGSLIRLLIAGSDEYQFSATELYLIDNNVKFSNASSNPLIFQDISSTATDTTTRTLEFRGQDKSGNTSTIAGAVLVRAGDATGAGGTHTGGNLTLRAGQATGGSGTRTGGDLIIYAGSGASANGTIKFLNPDGSTLEYSFTGSIADFKDNSLSFGASPPGSGTIRLSSTQNIVFFLANSNTVAAVTEASSRFVFGANDGALLGLDLSVGTGSNILVKIAGATEYTFNASEMVFASGNDLAFDNADANPLIYQQTTSTATDTTTRTLEIRGQDKSGATNTIAGVVLVRAGDATGSGGTATGGKTTVRGGNATGSTGTRTGGDLELFYGTGATANGNVVIGAVGKYTFSATTANFGGNTITNIGSVSFGSGTLPAIGVLRVAHNTTVIAGKNNAGSTDINLMRWGVAGTDWLDLGDTNIAAFNFRMGSGNFDWEIATGTAMVLSSTLLDLRNGVVGLQFPDPGSGSTIKVIDSSTAGTSAASLTISGQIRSASTGTNVGGTVTINGGDATGSTATHTGGTLTLRGGDATGSSGTRTGADLILRAGTGATANGTITFKDGSTTTMQLNGTTLSFAGSFQTIQLNDLATTIKQIDSSATGTGQGMTIAGQLKSASTGTNVGGALTIKGGDVTGATATHTGGALLLRGGDATGGSGTRNGGAVEVHTGTGANNDGTFYIYIGATQRFQFNASSIHLAATTAPTILVDNLATGIDFKIRASGSTSGNTNGGNLLLQGGERAGTGNYGGVKMQLNSNDATFYTMVEVVHLANAQRIVSLAKAGDLTTTEMPANTGDGVIYVANAVTVPTANPVSGGIMYATGGALKWRGTSGTITTMGTAEPHCPRCGADFAHEWKSEKYGELSVCIPCLVKALDKHGVSPDEWVISRVEPEAA